MNFDKFVHNDLFWGIISRKEINKLIHQDKIDFSNVVLISILDPYSDFINNLSSEINVKPLPHKFTNRFKDSITVKFWDVEKEIQEYKPISTETAIQLANFIRIYKDLNVKFLIHCNAGISRSAGVGMAVRCIKKFDGDKYLFHTSWNCDIKKHRRYAPNMYVFDKIIQEYDIMKMIEENELFIKDYIERRIKDE